MTRIAVALAWLAAVATGVAQGFDPPGGRSDLDAFMQEVLTRRDDNWKKLEQYILDEREQRELRWAAGVLLWSERRDYTWYIRNGFFVRSPLTHNGLKIGEADRRQYEADYLRRVQNRDRRGAAGQAQADEGDAAAQEPADVAGLIRQTRQPQFVSAASFMRYRFDEGSYALAGREKFAGYEVLRVEYYPKNLFRDRRNSDRNGNGDGTDALMRRLLNKVALVTMWIEPKSRQIVKSTFDNVNLDFLPVPWLVRVDEFQASTTMGEAFPDVWLPRELRVSAELTFPFGPVEYRHAVDYHDYRQADATIRIR